jgi:hypothetical protein
MMVNVIELIKQNILFKNYRAIFNWRKNVLRIHTIHVQLPFLTIELKLEKNEEKKHVIGDRQPTDIMKPKQTSRRN